MRHSGSLSQVQHHLAEDVLPYPTLQCPILPNPAPGCGARVCHKGVALGCGTRVWHCPTLLYTALPFTESKSLSVPYAGLFAVVFSCGYIASIGELYGSEGCAQVYVYLINFFSRCIPRHQHETNNHMARTGYFPKVLCYDDACHLVRYARNRSGEHELARQPL